MQAGKWRGTGADHICAAGPSCSFILHPTSYILPLRMRTTRTGPSTVGISNSLTTTGRPPSRTPSSSKTQALHPRQSITTYGRARLMLCLLEHVRVVLCPLSSCKRQSMSKYRHDQLTRPRLPTPQLHHVPPLEHISCTQLSTPFSPFSASSPSYLPRPITYLPTNHSTTLPMTCRPETGCLPKIPHLIQKLLISKKQSRKSRISKKIQTLEIFTSVPLGSSLPPCQRRTIKRFQTPRFVHTSLSAHQWALSAKKPKITIAIGDVQPGCSSAHRSRKGFPDGGRCKATAKANAK